MRSAQHTTIRQSTPRHISDFFNVKSIARRLGSYSYAEMRLMEAQAGWIASIPLAELKIELGYQLFEDAFHVDMMRRRLPKVGGFGELTLSPNERFVLFCNEFTNTEDVLERLVGVYWVLRPHLAATYREHIAQDDSVANFPTVRLLQHAAADHEKYAAWGDEVIRELADDPGDLARAEAWRDHLLALLDAAGGVTGEAPYDGPSIAARDDGPGKRFSLAKPVRDERFRVQTYERHEGRAATDVWDRETLVKYMFMMVEGELEATEACGRTLFDFPDTPWSLRFLIAQQLWDEARHAELSLQRFLEMGGTLDMLPVRDSFPLYLGPVHNQDLCRRLAHLNQVVEGWVMDDFAMMVDICRGMGDELTAHLFEYLITDE